MPVFEKSLINYCKTEGKICQLMSLHFFCLQWVTYVSAMGGLFLERVR
jgi:hypothetical protein